MQNLDAEQHKTYRTILNELIEDPRAEFLLTNKERDFLAHAKKHTHIHWPVLWAEQLDDIAEKLS